MINIVEIWSRKTLFAGSLEECRAFIFANGLRLLGDPLDGKIIRVWKGNVD